MRTMLKLEICCRHCRRPTSRCICSSSGGQSYAGSLIGGRCKEIGIDLDHMANRSFRFGMRNQDGEATACQAFIRTWFLIEKQVRNSTEIRPYLF